MSSIKDVAREAGVSTATVSHVINNTRFVSDRVRARVMQSIEKCRYYPNAHARSLASGRSRIIGLVISDIANPFFPELVSDPEGRSFNSTIPMPFKTGVKIVMVNESKNNLDELFYDVDYTLGDRHSANMLYFHAHYRRENPTTIQKDYEILPRVAGRGRYLGANIGVIVNTKEYFNTWWGEGEVKMYLDGDRDLPTIAGTGAEDYIGTAWGQGKFAHLYQGSPVADETAMRWSFYRYHVVDPIYFYRDARVTMQQIGYLAPHSRVDIIKNNRTLYRAGPGLVPMDTSKDGKFERTDDWSSCVYFYLDKPTSNLPPIDAVEKRITGL